MNVTEKIRIRKDHREVQIAMMMRLNRSQRPGLGDVAIFRVTLAWTVAE